MPRKKIMIEKLDTERKIMVTYAKRRATVFKKAGQLCALHPGGQTRVAVITFSARGRPFVFGSPDIHSVVDAFLCHLDEPPAFPIPSGGDPALVAQQSAAGSPKGKRKWEEEDWLSLEGCDTLEALEAKRDEFVKVKAMIDELKLNKAEAAGEIGVDWDLASTSAAPPPMVSTDDDEQQCLSDMAAAGGAESSAEFVIGDDDVYVSLDAFFP